MGEADGVLLELAWRGREWLRARNPRARAPAPQTAGSAELAEQLRELEVFLGALFARRFAIAPLDPPRRRLPWPTRLRASPAHEALAGTDGRDLYLPRRLEPPLDPQLARLTGPARLRAMALGLAARIERRSLEVLPQDRLARDLCWSAEGAELQAWLGAELPGLAPELAAARAFDRAQRPQRRRPTPLEQRCERFVLELLDGAALRESGPSLARWSIETAHAWRRELGGAYRGVAPVPHWGVPLPASASPDSLRRAARPGAVRLPARELRSRASLPPERLQPETRSGPWLVPPGEPSLAAQPTARITRPLDRAPELDLETLASELERARRLVRVRSEHAVHDVLESGPAADPDRPALESGLAEPRPGEWRYPEWDHRAHTYRPRFCRVRALPAPEGDAAWAPRVLAEQRSLLRELRAQARRLQPRPELQPRQWLGDELDVDAYVELHADACAGSAHEERVYRRVRRARRDCAIALLLDTSASTERSSAPGRCVLDLAREAALLLGEATRGLDDRHALYAFSSRGAGDVRVHALRRFGEPHGPAVQRRLAALEPAHGTRLGAALRHVTAQLALEPASVRALLLLSDGHPMDEDGYGGAYGIADTRRAVREARALGIRPLCVCIHPEPERDPRSIFGSRGCRSARDLTSLALGLGQLQRTLALP